MPGQLIALIVLVASLLVGCNPWSIASVNVNPQPVASEAVIPVQIIAPQDPSGVSSAKVSINIQLKRDSGFTDPVETQVTAKFHLPSGNIWPLSQQFSRNHSSDGKCFSLVSGRAPTIRPGSV